jgi:hypothetical protein
MPGNKKRPLWPFSFVVDGIALQIIDNRYKARDDGRRN